MRGHTIGAVVCIILAVTAGQAHAQGLKLLRGLEIGAAATQALDFDSTRRALQSGNGREGNPVVRALIGRSIVFASVKAAAAVGIVAVAESLNRNHHRRAAVIMLAGMTSFYGVVIIRNYQIASGRR